jgi:glycosyltransferase involved in cell wall biosynthesis
MSEIFITTSYGDLSISKYFLGLSEELARRGHRITVIVAGQRRDVVNREGNPAFLTWPSQRPTGWRDAAFLYARIRERRPDCIIGNFGAVNWCMLIGGLCGVRRRIAWYHSITRALDADSTAPGWKRALLKLRKRGVYQSATDIIANSAAAARDIQAVYGVPAAKCRTLSYLIPDPPHHNDGNAANLVLCVGRLNRSKGQETLLRAAPRIRQAVPDVTIEFVGDGPERGAYERLAAELGVRDCCRFAGARSLTETLVRQSQAAVSVTTSRSEALGLACIEAQAAGTPVVASAVDGLAEVVRDGDTGYLVPPDDPDALAARVITLLTNPALRRRFGQRAREHFLATFCDRNLSRHADIIEEIAR